MEPGPCLCIYFIINFKSDIISSLNIFEFTSEAVWVQSFLCGNVLNCISLTKIVLFRFPLSPCFSFYKLCFFKDFSTFYMLLTLLA